MKKARDHQAGSIERQPKKGTKSRLKGGWADGRNRAATPHICLTDQTDGRQRRQGRGMRIFSWTSPAQVTPSTALTLQ
jgi:hypothetical protein